MSSGSSVKTSRVPTKAGVGLRPAHFTYVLESEPDIGWFEAHSENYFGKPGPLFQALEQIRARYPISFHGVGLSLGSTDTLSVGHLNELKKLIRHIQPALVSDHLSWSSVGGKFSNDLLPMPFTAEAVNHMVDRIQSVQEQLGCRILVENVSSYLEFTGSEMPEWAFVTEVVRRSGCGLLLDINNVYVNSRNHGFDAWEYLRNIPPEMVHEIHLAGHSVKQVDGTQILIDTHNDLVSDPVWDLYSFALERIGAVPTLIEWDRDLPPFATLEQEARKADSMIQEYGHGAPA